MLTPLRLSIGVFLLALCLPQPLQAKEDFEELCRLVKSGTLIRKPASCVDYIQCIYGEGTKKSCEESMVFDANSQKCVKATESNSKHCGNLCEGLDDIWVADPTNCQNYFFCREGVSLSGHCEESQHFDEISQSCEYGVDSKCVDVANICELLPDKAKFRQETDCNEYYECKSGKHSLKSCSSSQYFDVNKAACAAKNLVECDAHSKKDVCVKSKKPVVGSQPDGATCRGYFYCANFGSVPDVDPMWFQCSEHYFFNPDTKQCDKPTNVVCTHNRCEGRGTMLVASSKNNCHNYISCENGVQIEEKTCHWDYFFDENLQSCVERIIYDKCCDGRD